MKVEVTKLVSEYYMQRACSFTTGKPSSVSLKDIYRCEHSPMRTQLFWIEMTNIPTFVSVHLVRHKIGVEHFVKSNRDDRGGKDNVENRLTPVDHAMLIDAQALINMARKRLCNKAHTLTIGVMYLILEAVRKVDPELTQWMVPECDYRGARCFELRPCGKRPVG